MAKNEANPEKNLQQAFNYLRTFYKEAAQMMTDIIEKMEKNDWKPSKEYITDDLSYSLNNPEKWMYYYIYKNFVKKEEATYYKGLLIFFDEIKSDFPPSVVCGNVNVQTNFYEQFHIWKLWEDNKEKLVILDGKEMDVETTFDNKVISGKLFAIPLTAIENKEKLQELVIRRFLEL